LPEPVEALLEAALVGEFTVLDGRGRPVVHPMIPFYTGDGRVYLTSSVLFSRKLLHLKQNPRCALSITDPLAAPVDRFGQVTIQGDATVVDDDPHRGWLWLLPTWARKEPTIPALVRQRWALPLFWERAVVVLTPRRVFHWPPAPPVRRSFTNCRKEASADGPASCRGCPADQGASLCGAGLGGRGRLPDAAAGPV